MVPATGIDFPGAQQVFRVVRYTGGLDRQRTRKEVENAVHWVRDDTAHRAHTGNAPAVLAAIRNVVTTALRLTGAVNMAAARRSAALNHRRAIELFTPTPKLGRTPL